MEPQQEDELQWCPDAVLTRVQVNACKCLCRLGPIFLLLKQSSKLFSDSSDLFFIADDSGLYLLQQAAASTRVVLSLLCYLGSMVYQLLIAHPSATSLWLFGGSLEMSWAKTVRSCLLTTSGTLSDKTEV